MTTATAPGDAAEREQMLLSGRVAMLYALSQPYLLLPFATLAMAAAVMQSVLPMWLTVPPFLGQIVMLVVGMRLKDAYKRRIEDNPRLWANRYTFLSGMSGAVWGLAAMVWFVPGAYSAQAYLVLAYLGMTATEFVSRAAYRPAFVAHSAMSLLPLAALLVSEGNSYQIMTAALIVCFAGVLSTYSGTIASYFDETVLLRNENAKLILTLSQEKRQAEAARDSARASDRAKSSFISSISHEIRTPLNAILGMAQLLERSEMEKSQRNHVKVLLEAGRGLKTLLDDIIALAQTDDELTAGIPEEGTDAAQAARTVARLLQPNAWEKRLRLSVNVAAGLPRVAADARVLRRVLLKLASNAIKFTERGGIEIALDTMAGENNRLLVRFRITDTGTGIPAHILTNIFEPFAKGDVSYSRRHNGAGVGLAVAKRLTASMGGTIGAESDPGAGATFWITVPASLDGVSDVSGLAEDVPPPGGLSILAWVEDTATKATLDNLLTPFGNRIAFAGSLAEAAAQSARGGFALVIAGAPAVDALAAAPGQSTPILALAASDARTPDGADGVLRWPAPQGALYSAIGTIMDGSSVKGGANAEDIAGAALDAKAFGELEKSLGLKTLVDILQSYLGTAEQLSTALEEAMQKEDWVQAGRIAQDIAGAAGGLGLTALTGVARTLAMGARDGMAEASLKQAATGIYAEHKRAREALKKLYPDLAA